MDCAGFFGFDWALFVHWVASDVQDTTQGRGANRNADRRAGVDHVLATNETFGRVHRNCTKRVLAQVLSNFENQLVAVVVNFESVQNGRHIAVKLNVDNGANHLGDFAFLLCHVSFLRIS